MSLRKNGRGVIRLHDMTDHGGKVIKVAHGANALGKSIACKGDLVSCPRCKGVFPIIEGDALYTIHGTPVALDGHKTACGATLISSVK